MGFRNKISVVVYLALITGLGCSADGVRVVEPPGVPGAEVPGEAGAIFAPRVETKAFGWTGIEGELWDDEGHLAFVAWSSDGLAGLDIVGERLELRVRIDGDDATMSIGDVVLSGRGALTQEQRAALDGLANARAAQWLWALPIELACMRMELDPAVWAALVFGWQMLIKHSVDWLDPRETVSGGSCDPFATPSPLEDGPIRISPEDPVPWVQGYLLLDVEGAMDAASAGATWSAACEHYCVGACGSNCDPDACWQTTIYQCLTDTTGAPTGRSQRTLLSTCGSHQGCRVHDGCYDQCNDAYGCSGLYTFFCKRSCDADCLAEYCFDGVATCECTAWVFGWGPFDTYLDYEAPIGAPQFDAGCQPSEL